MSMKDTMDQELVEAVETLKRANSALERLFGKTEEEGE